MTETNLERRFEKKTETSYKFWCISRNRNYTKVKFGKIGTQGTTRDKRFETNDEAQTYLEKQIKSKLKSGYSELAWKSDHFQHQKLIFDEPIVEQHGLTKGEKRQVFESGAKFFLRGILFPLQFATRKPHRCCDSNQGWESNEGYQFSKKCNCIDCRR